jgi:hypothetical protein
MNIFYMVMNFVSSACALYWARARGYEVIANLEDQKKRWDTCGECPFNVEGQCQKCGCLIQAKIMLTTSKCPDKRWLRIWRKRATTK